MPRPGAPDDASRLTPSPPLMLGSTCYERWVGEHHGGMSPSDLVAGVSACAVQAWEELVEAPAPHLVAEGHV